MCNSVANAGEQVVHLSGAISSHNSDKDLIARAKQIAHTLGEPSECPVLEPSVPVSVQIPRFDVIPRTERARNISSIAEPLLGPATVDKRFDGQCFE
jgi:hypothetical protein